MAKKGDSYHPAGANDDVQRLFDTTEAYEYVNHPTHYNRYSHEVIDMMCAIYGVEDTALFCEMNAFKYRMRMGTKPNNSVNQDLEKETWYLNKATELRNLNK